MADHEFTHTNPDIDVHAMGEMHEHPTLEAVQVGRAHPHAHHGRRGVVYYTRRS